MKYRVKDNPQWPASKVAREWVKWFEWDGVTVDEQGWIFLGFNYDGCVHPDDVEPYNQVDSEFWEIVRGER